MVKFSFTWTIDNFLFCREEPGEKLDSAIFSTGSNDKIEWCLRAYPKGYVKEVSDYMSLYLVLASSNRVEVLTKFELSILNTQGEKMHTMDSEKVDKFIPGGVWGFRKFVKLDFLLNKDHGLLADDNLTLLCEGTFAEDRVNLSGPSGELKPELPESKICEDFGALFETQKFSDVTLSVGGKDLLVHKLILAARSPVFAAMFKHEMAESKQNRVTIQDVDYDVLREMLMYIYTGKSPNLESMAEDLLALADKYDLGGLKAMCETVLCSSITVENAANLLVLADMHCAKQLRTQIIHYISVQAKEVMRTPAWKNMSLTYPHVIIEAFEALASQ